MAENKPNNVSIPRWALAVAAAVVALLVLLVIVLIPGGKDSNPVAAGSSNNTEQLQPASSSAAEPSISALAASSSASTNHRAVCDVKVPTGKESSAEVPSDYTWAATSDGAQYPVSAIYGPTVKVGKTGQCFAHNPTGAAMAAISLLHAQSDPQISEAERRALLSARTSNDPLDNPTPQSLDMQVFGYEVQSYRPEQATVQFAILSRSPRRVVVQFTIRVVWEDGDWRFDSDDSEIKPKVLTDTNQLPSHVFKKNDS